MATAAKVWFSRDEYKAAKQLDEARKAGTAPPEQDDEGKDINPHIPSYIATAPWYLSTGKPGLKHQRKQDFGAEKGQRYDDITTWYARGQTQGPAATKFRPGSCANCGSMTHQKKDCTSRPRKIGAWKTGKDIQPDEIILDVQLDYEGKRDRWNGYDPRMYQPVMEKYQEADLARRKKIAEEKAAKFMTEPDAAHKRYPHEGGGDGKDKPEGTLADEYEEKKDEEGDETGDQFSKRDPRTRTTVRNLRIREDRAKYLVDLNPDSAFYDPKSRSMRDLPSDQLEESNFVITKAHSLAGDTSQFLEMQRYAWEACHEKPGEVPNIFAEPSAAELLFEDMQRKKAQVEKETKSKLATEYGGEQYMKAPPMALLVGQSEIYREYTPDGTLIKGKEVIPKSKYPEDVLTNKHKAVWGSWYDKTSGKWGYACCKQIDRMAFCTGQAIPAQPALIPTASQVAQPVAMPSVGTLSPVEAEVAKEKTAQPDEPQDETPKKKEKKEKKSKGKSGKKKRRSDSSESESSDSESSDSESSDSESSGKSKRRKSSKKKHSKKSKKSSKKRHKKQKERSTGDEETPSTKKRKYNSLEADSIKPPSEQEWDDYKKKKSRSEDPMQNPHY